jgi:hypothetical protein
MATRWLVKTNPTCVVVSPHLAPLQGASLGGRRFLGFHFAASGGRRTIIQSRLRRLRTRTFTSSSKKKGQPTGETVPNAP